MTVSTTDRCPLDRLLRLPLVDAKESPIERLLRVLAGIPAETLGPAMVFDSAVYDRATALAKAVDSQIERKVGARPADAEGGDG